MTQLIKGDVVTMRGAVTYVDTDGDGENGVTVKLEGHYSNIFVDTKHLTFVHHKFEVGDQVRHSGMEVRGTVLGVHDDYAWVEADDHSFLTLNLSGLALVKEEPAESGEINTDEATILEVPAH